MENQKPINIPELLDRYAEYEINEKYYHSPGTAKNYRRYIKKLKAFFEANPDFTVEKCDRLALLKLEIWLIKNNVGENTAATIVHFWKRVILFAYNIGQLEKQAYEAITKKPKETELTWPSELELNQNDFTLFIPLLFNHLNQERVYKRLKYSTIQKHITQFRNICAFLNSMNAINIKSADLRLKHMNMLKVWLIENKTSCSVSHASRHAETCKRALDHGVVNDYIDFNALSALKSERTKTKEVVHLEQKEIEKLQQFDITNIETKVSKKLRQYAADLYLFQCYTGLSYGDLSSYKVVQKDETLWIENKRNKNENPYMVPLFPEAKAIYEKYQGNLPTISNQVYNRTIKEVARDCAIQKYLTTHTARKTFATLMDQRGVSTKTISDMLGNTLAVCQKHYLGKSSKRIELELQKLGILKNAQTEKVEQQPIFMHCKPCLPLSLQKA